MVNYENATAVTMTGLNYLYDTCYVIPLTHHIYSY